MRSSPRATWSSSAGLGLVIALAWGAVAHADPAIADGGIAQATEDAGLPTRVASVASGEITDTGSPELNAEHEGAAPEGEGGWSSIVKGRLGLAVSARGAFFSKDLSLGGQTGFAVGSLWLTARPEPVFGIRTHLDARVQAQDTIRSSHLSWDLREAYAETSLGDFDFKIGRQLTVWGRADAVNPTDVWSTRDYTFLAPDDTDQLLGVAAAEVAWNHWDHRLIAYWQAEWRPPVYPLGVVPPGIEIRNLDPKAPLGQLGVKLDHSGGRMDYSISYAHVVNKVPDLALLTQGPAGVELGFQFNRIDMVGADAAIVLGDFGLRLEAAYTHTRNNAGDNPLEQDSSLFGVLGVDRTFGGVFNVNVQYLHRHMVNWRDASQIENPILRLGAEQEQIATNQLAQDMPGASARLDYKAFNETLEAECALEMWFAKTNAALRPKVTYAFTDHIKALVGGQIYLGPKNSFFGRFEGASAVLGEIRLNL